MGLDDTIQSVTIQFLSGPLAGRAIPFKKNSITIGRNLGNDIAISSDPQVSRKHARITWNGQSWRIENLSHNNVLLVNDQETQDAPLITGAIVALGENTTFRVLSEVKASALSTPSEPLTDSAATLTPAESHDAIAITAPPSRPLTQDVMNAKAPPSRPLTVAVEGAQRHRVEATQVARVDDKPIPTLEITSNTQDGKRVFALIDDVISIGRDANNDLVINERIVSGQHLQIVREGDQWTLIHPHPDRTETLNGLLYQGRKIGGDEEFSKTLEPGDLFRIGDENGALVTLSYHDGTNTDLKAPRLIEPVKLGAQELTIGRASDNTLVLTHPQVSTHHARLTRTGATYQINDLNSTNHVYVNGQAITRATLRTGDEIRIGPYRLLYESNQLSPYDEGNFIRINAVNLKKSGANGVTLLDDITISIPPRSFVALVGGSGAGKSTLLDALNGQRPAQSGKVFFNDEDYYKNVALFATQIGYVPQDDIVHRDLTVDRALYYAAKLRLPSDFTEEQIKQRINEVLEEVELTHRRTLMMRDLSGGQRKRVSIALELLANPSVFFLDEPTSGLDPGLDRKMMFLLRRLADRGHTIVLVTHATNNINSCDYVCFLSAGGRLAFFGPPEEAKSFFGKSDFAEIYTSLEATDEAPSAPADAQARFSQSQEYTRYITAPVRKARSSTTSVAHKHPPSTLEGQEAFSSTIRKLGQSWAQFRLLSMRYIELLKNDRGNLLILLLQAPVIAVMLVLMLRFEIGPGVFNASSIAECRSQIVTANGPLTLPQAQHSALISCQDVATFLRTTPDGQQYALAHGGVNTALQNFIMPGLGADAQKALFIMAFTTILFGCINGAREFVKEAPIYRRERAVNLGIAPYMFSKIVVLGLLCLFQSAVVVLAVELGEPLHQGVLTSPVLETYVTLALTSIAGLMFGLAVSAVAPNNDRAISLVPLVLLPQVIFSGAIIPLKDWATQILSTIFPSRWAMAALGSTVGLHSDNISGDRLFGDDYTYHGTLFSIYTSQDAINRLLLSWGSLVAIIAVLTLAIGIFLARKDTAR
jgi:ABC-type multidrug transport system ATPase subunit/pSer/pThr/pTyr-binding forkhead associated (FHA) protein